MFEWGAFLNTMQISMLRGVVTNLHQTVWSCRRLAVAQHLCPKMRTDLSYLSWNTLNIYPSPKGMRYKMRPSFMPTHSHWSSVKP